MIRHCLIEQIWERWCNRLIWNLRWVGAAVVNIDSVIKGKFMKDCDGWVLDFMLTMSLCMNGVMLGSPYHNKQWSDITVIWTKPAEKTQLTQHVKWTHETNHTPLKHTNIKCIHNNKQNKGLIPQKNMEQQVLRK